MRIPNGLKKLDDRVIGSKKKRARSDHDGDGDHDGGRAGSQDDSKDDGGSTRTAERTETKKPRGNGDGLQKLLGTVWRISQLVFFALAAVLVLAIAVMVLPTNADNVIVRNILELGDTLAGPFRDVFTDEDPERMNIYNYGLAAAVFVVVGVVVAKLPTGGKRGG